jgi:hypothetical protein
VLAAEIIGFVTAFDMASSLRDVLEEIYQQSIPLYGLTDSYSFFSTVTQYNALREKRLSIEVAVVREAYAKFELANLGCENGVQPGRPYDKNCQKHAFRKAPRHGSGGPSRRRVPHARADDP